MTGIITDPSPDRRAIRLLQAGPLVRRRGRWSFGATRISDHIIVRLIAAGVAVSDGETVVLAPSVARPGKHRYARNA